MVRVGGRGVVLERLVVRDVVILVAVLAGAGAERGGQFDADRGNRVADALVGGVRARGAGPRALNWFGANVEVGCPAPEYGVDGREAAWNQTQDRPWALSRSPTFWPDSATASRVEQSS